MVWGERLFLLSAVPMGVEGVASHEPRGQIQPRSIHRFIVLAIDRRSGLSGNEPPAMKDCTWASSSAVTDGQRVYAFFESSGLYTYDMAGNLLWQNAQRAMRVIRSNAARWTIDARTRAVVGFSAGGYLAATLSTAFAEPVYVPVDGVDAVSARPFAAALIYPVVTMALPGTHPVSRELLLGPNPPPVQVTRRSAELHVAAETPPLLLVPCDRRHRSAGLEQFEPAQRHACREPAGGGTSLSGGRARVCVGVSEFPDIVMDRRLRRLVRSTPDQPVEPGFPGHW